MNNRLRNSFSLGVCCLSRLRFSVWFCLMWHICLFSSLFKKKEGVRVVCGCVCVWMMCYVHHTPPHLEMRWKTKRVKRPPGRNLPADTHTATTLHWLHPLRANTMTPPREHKFRSIMQRPARAVIGWATRQSCTTTTNWPVASPPIIALPVSAPPEHLTGAF